MTAEHASSGHAGRQAVEVWRCTGCPRVLGSIAGEMVTIRWSGRQVTFRLPRGEACSQVCDRCGTLNVRTGAVAGTR